MRTVVAAGLVAMPAAQSADAAEVLTLKPSTPWNVDYADDSCALRREFKNGADTALLELRQFAPGDGFEVTVAAKSLAVKERAAKVRFAPEDKPRKIDRPLCWVYADDVRAVRWSDSLFADDTTEVAPGQVRPQRSEAAYKAREAAVRGLEIGGVYATPILLETGEMNRAMAGMRACLDELVTHWGIDAAAQKTLTRRARPVGQLEWAKQIQANYPSAMLKAGKSGRVRVRMVVSADGTPTSCNVQSVVQDLSFGQTACDGMMKAARFEPALDAAGKPIASYYQTIVTYTVN